MAKIALTDHFGQPIPRFGAAGVKKTLMAQWHDPEVDPMEFAMVHCELSECFILRVGANLRTCTYQLVYWDHPVSDQVNVTEVCAGAITENFTHKEQTKSIAAFLKLCKRDPLYETA